MAMQRNKANEVNISWTLFVQLTHWLVAALVITNFFNDTAFWHRMIGYACLALVLLRVFLWLVCEQSQLIPVL